jgi:beta-N-acetylhexosaminidase
MVSGDFSNIAASTPYAQAGVGAFVFFGQPAATDAPRINSGLAALFNGARAAGQVFPWVSTDEEGGYEDRLSNVIGELPTPRAMAQNWSPSYLQSKMTAHARAMWYLGVTMDLAPVLDTALATHTVADENDRSFSFDPRVASAYGNAFINGLRRGGVTAVGKHFPGYGQASANTDAGPAVDPPLSELESRDLIPFRQAISNGLRVIMITNASVPGLTGTVPATLSAATYRYLRTRLHFTGVALTDSLGAGAIVAAGYSQPAAALTALESGADMVLIHPSELPSALVAIGNAVTSGALPLSQVNASVTRILVAKGVNLCAG